MNGVSLTVKLDDVTTHATQWSANCDGKPLPINPYLEWLNQPLRAPSLASLNMYGL